MSDLKDDASKVLADTKAEIGKLETVEKSASGWVKTHVAIVWGLVAFLAGALVGHWA